MAKVFLLILLGAVIVGVGQGIADVSGLAWEIAGRVTIGLGMFTIFRAGVLDERIR